MNPNISLNDRIRVLSHLVGLIDEVSDVCVSHGGNIGVAAAAAAGLQRSRRGGRNTGRLFTSNLVQKTATTQSRGGGGGRVTNMKITAQNICTII